MQFLFQQPPDSLRPGDILIRPGVEGFSTPRLLGRDPRPAPRARRRRPPIRRCPGSQCLAARRRRAPAPRDPSRVGAWWWRAPTHRSASPSCGCSGSRRATRWTVAPALARPQPGAASEAYEAVWLGPTGRGDSVDLRPDAPSRGAAGRRDRDRLRQRAGRTDVGRGWWTGGSSVSPSKEAPPFTWASSGGSCTPARGGTSSSAASSSIPPSPLRIAEEEVRRFDADGDELGEARPVRRSASSAPSGAWRMDGNWRPVSRARAWHEPDWATDRRPASPPAHRGLAAPGGAYSRPMRVWTGIYRRATLDGTLVARRGSGSALSSYPARLRRTAADPARRSPRRRRRVSRSAYRRAPWRPRGHARAC